MSIKSKVISGGMWSGISSAYTMASQFLRIIILTRFLEKSDFGIMSIVNMTVGFCIAFSDIGFSSVIMYKQKISNTEFSSLYWIQLTLYTFIYLMLFALAPLISYFFEDESLILYIRLASLSIICLAIGKLYDSVFQKQFLFKKLAYRNIVTYSASLIVAVLLAYNGYGIFSLIYSALLQSIIYNLWNIISGVRIQPIKLFFNWKEAKPLVRIGVYQTFTRIADYLSDKIDIFIIGKFLGTEALGVYDLAKELVYKLVSFVRSVVIQVALPLITSANSDDNEVRQRFLIVTKVIAYFCIPVCVSFSVFSKDVVNIVYGSKFIEMWPMVSIFSILTMIASIGSFIDMLGVAKGRTDLNFMNTVYRIAVTTPLITIAAFNNLITVAFAQLFSTIIMSIIFWNVVALKTYPMRWQIYIQQFSKILFISIMVGTVFYLINHYYPLPFVVNNYLNFSVRLLLYTLCLIAIYRIALKEDIVFFKNQFIRK